MASPAWALWSFLSTADFLSLLFPLKASLIIKTLLCAAWLHRWSCSSAKHVHNTSRDIDLTGTAFNLSEPHLFLCKTGSSLTACVCAAWLVGAWKLTDGFFLIRHLDFFAIFSFLFLFILYTLFSMEKSSRFITVLIKQCFTISVWDCRGEKLLTAMFSLNFNALTTWRRGSSVCWC